MKNALFGLLAGFAVSSMNALAAPVAMVTDMKGTAEMHVGAKKSPLGMLTELDANTQVTVGKGGEVVLMYMQTGEEFVFSGAGKYTIGDSAPVAVSGNAPQKRTTIFSKVASAPKIKPGGLAQAAVVMRSVKSEPQIRLLSLADTVTLDLNPEFRWEGVQQGSVYAFELKDEYDTLVWQAQLEDTSAWLPPSIRLKEGHQYTWKVSSTDNGRTLSSNGQFRIAPLDIRIQVESLRPTPEAPVSDHVAFAVWLRQTDFKDEARKYWKVLSGERKSEDRLQAMSRE